MLMLALISLLKRKMKKLKTQLNSLSFSLNSLIKLLKICQRKKRKDSYPSQLKRDLVENIKLVRRLVEVILLVEV
jgi:hypothetical protein